LSAEALRHPIPDRPPARRLAAAPEPPPSSLVALAERDPDLLAGIPDAERGLARRMLAAPRVVVSPGAWTPPEALGPSVLLVDGVLARNAQIGDRVATHLLGPTDIVDLEASGDGRGPYPVAWHVHETITAAVLDERFVVAACRWPSLFGVVQRRMTAMSDRLAVQLAICQIASVDDRLLAILGHLAERFGRVTPDGVVVDLRLDHRLLGQLVGAKRPTVSLALTRLVEAGALARRADRRWVLPLW
jgi:CRP/FNR family transcriptional regulator, cyclic AMP receptor protein